VIRGRRSSRRLKVVLAGLVLAGSMSFLTVSGTYAVFTSEEHDAGGFAASGTLTMSNLVTGGSICNSFDTGSTGNAMPTCPSLMTTGTLRYPGASASAVVALKNTGSLGTTPNLTVYMPTCASSTTTGSAVVGGGNPCQEITEGSSLNGLELAIEQVTDSTGTTVSQCLYPFAYAGACTADTTNWANNGPNSFGIFAEYVNTSGSAYSLGTGPAAGVTRYIKVTVTLPTNASNTLQGETATFGLSWHLST
jgi:hypothetical protein